MTEPRQPEALSAQDLEKIEQIFDLARTGATADLMQLIAQGLPVNFTDGKGDTLLILAAYRRRTDTVAALLQHGADPDRVNDQGQTALAAAVVRNDAELVGVLLAVGADPEAGSRRPAEIADFFGLDEMAHLLAEHADRAPGVS